VGCVEDKLSLQISSWQTAKTFEKMPYRQSKKQRRARSCGKKLWIFVKNERGVFQLKKLQT
jgi:hypothetical protein